MSSDNSVLLNPLFLQENYDRGLREMVEACLGMGH